MSASVLTDIYEEDHRIFREGFRRFIEAEILPYHDEWESQGHVDRDLWLKAGAQGFLGIAVPEEYGGLGVADFRFNNIITEELTRVGATAVGFPTHTDITVPYLIHYGSEEQKKKYLPKAVSGECIIAIGMTEPNTGSDLGAISTTALPAEDGYTLNGQKTFITNGLLGDLVIVACKTNPKERHSGMSLVLVEKGAKGFAPGKKLKKIGMHGQDTAELYFENVAVAAGDLLGEEGKGFHYLMSQLPQERLHIATLGLAGAETALDHTIAYCKERHAFGKPIGTFQNSKFKLAEMKTEVTIGRTFVNQCTLALNDGKLTPEIAAMAKWWTTEMQNRVVDACVQLHGGYGYMREYPVARAFIDTRAQTIYGGTTEIMKEIIGRSLGFR